MTVWAGTVPDTGNPQLRSLPRQGRVAVSSAFYAEPAGGTHFRASTSKRRGSFAPHSVRPAQILLIQLGTMMTLALEGRTYTNHGCLCALGVSVVNVFNAVAAVSGSVQTPRFRQALLP
jgi:hypothetical protein